MKNEQLFLTSECWLWPYRAYLGSWHQLGFSADLHCVSCWDPGWRGSCYLSMMFLWRMIRVKEGDGLLQEKGNLSLPSMEIIRSNQVSLKGNRVREKEWIFAEQYYSLLSYVSFLSCIQLFLQPWTIAHQAPLSMGFPKQEHWSRLPLPSLGDLPDPGIKCESPALAGGFFTTAPPGKLYNLLHNIL